MGFRSGVAKQPVPQIGKSRVSHSLVFAHRTAFVITTGSSAPVCGDSPQMIGDNRGLRNEPTISYSLSSFRSDLSSSWSMLLGLLQGAQFGAQCSPRYPKDLTGPNLIPALVAEHLTQYNPVHFHADLRVNVRLPASNQVPNELAEFQFSPFR